MSSYRALKHGNMEAIMDFKREARKSNERYSKPAMKKEGFYCV